MSIIAEVLSTANEAEMLSLQKKMSEISHGVAVLRTRVKELMEVEYLKLLKGSNKSKPTLVDSASGISQNIKELQARLEQQTHTESSKVAEELRSLTETLIEARIVCEITQKLLDIDEEFEMAISDQNSRLYYSAAQHIVNIREKLTDCKSELEFSTVYDALVNKSSLNYSLFSGEALKMWKTEVSWIICQLDTARKTTKLQVHKSKDLLENLIKTLNVFGVCEPQVYYFSQSFYNEILIPTIDCQVTVDMTRKTEHVVLSISSVLENRPAVLDVLDNLTRIFEFLHQQIDLAIDDSRNFISELGLHLADKILSKLVRDCLSDAIPMKRQDLLSYKKLVDQIAKFNDLLKEIKFLSEGCDHLEKFCGNVEEQFLNKMIERYLSRAREISFLNLQDMTAIMPDNGEKGSKSSTQDLTKVRKELNQEHNIQFTELPDDFGQFPACHISKSVLELMELVREIIIYCVTADHPIPNTALKLFCTVKDCINLYVDISPVYHIKLLESLPQQSALFHNNCYYLSHELITLNESYRAMYNEQLMRVMGTFVDMVNHIRSQGLKTMEFQVSKQNTMLVEIVAQSGLSNLAEEDLPPMLEKSLRQGVHQLTFLETMWQSVLPGHVYNKIMGQLCNSFLEEVITRVCLTKDIKEATATHLVRLFGYVQESLPTLFEEPKEVHRHIKKWSKFTELIHVLNGSLAEIGDRWADGKGPLAMDFNAEQVRQLIRALFQVSDRRAAILSRIK